MAEINERIFSHHNVGFESGINRGSESLKFFYNQVNNAGAGRFSASCDGNQLTLSTPDHYYRSSPITNFTRCGNYIRVTTAHSVINLWLYN